VTSPDVVVIGAGIVGTAVAAELAGRGALVTVLERAGVAAGASGRNSGAVWYPQDGVLGELYRESLARYRSLPDELGAALPGDAPERSFRLPARPAGILEVGWDEDGLRRTAARTARSNPDFGASFVDPVALRALEPGLTQGLAAVRLEIGFPVAPAAATYALAGLARARGAEVREGVEAVVVRDGGRATGVRAGGRFVPAGAVVVAAGPGSPAVVDPSGTWRPIRPFWGVIVELALGPAAPRHVLEEAEVDAAIAPDAAARDDEGAVGFSLVTAAGRSSLGSTFLPGAEPDARAYEARLRRGGERYLPAIGEAPTRGLRACARPLALDGRPLVGAVPGTEGLFIAAGHGPWGISTGPASAAHVAALVLGEPDPRGARVRAATDAGRFGPPPA
jgi:glycine/D-amino acid oxidase-like deaminating enzyme